MRRGQSINVSLCFFDRIHRRFLSRFTNVVRSAGARAGWLGLPADANSGQGYSQSSWETSRKQQQAYATLCDARHLLGLCHVNVAGAFVDALSPTRAHPSA